MDRIAIIGLSPIGLSIGLALKRARLQETEVVGSSGERDELSVASKLGAVDWATGNLGKALEGAGLVVLDTPLSQMEAMLEAIGPVLDDGCVVTDTGSAKVKVTEWADTHLDKGSSFVGGHPIINRSLATPDDALFDGSYYGIVPSESTDPDAVKSVVGMVETLGARPLFMDAHEHDSYAAALKHLPLVVSFAMMGTAARAPTWADMSRVAEAEFGEITKLAARDPEEGASLGIANKEALANWIDRLISELSGYRELLSEDGDGLADAFIEAWEARARWQAGGLADEGGVEVPSAGQTMAGMVVGRRMADRYRQISKAGQRRPWEYRKNRRKT